jgi:hypothetical protein
MVRLEVGLSFIIVIETGRVYIICVLTCPPPVWLKKLRASQRLLVSIHASVRMLLWGLPVSVQF